MRRRQGFTLIELLIVIVIIGILAAIAIPKFGSVRARTYFKAMQADLRNLNTSQELYYTDPLNDYNYAGSTSDLPDYRTSTGVTVTMLEGSRTGWAAQASHAALSATQLCAIYIGTVTTAPAYVAGPGIVTCTGE